MYGCKGCVQVLHQTSVGDQFQGHVMSRYWRPYLLCKEVDDTLALRISASCGNSCLGT